MKVYDQTSAHREHDDDVLLRKTYATAQWRILPILFCLWMLAWVDRSNVAFAKLQMLSDLRFSETVYGLGAGLFFLAYVLCGVPTSLAQKRFGPRRVLAGVAVCWGLTSVAMMFVHTAGQFYVLRLLLGAFEAGFYPGVVLYFNHWFAGKRRARNFSIFHSGAICSTVAVGLTGGYVLANMDGIGGFEAWRWMFFAQAVPTVVVALVAYVILPDRPETARWLTPRQRTLLNDDLLKQQDRHEESDDLPPSVLFNGSIWLLSAAYFCIMAATTALVFFSPTILREAHFGGYQEIGRAVATICILGAIGNVLISTLGGEAKRRRAFCAFAALLTSASLFVLTFISHTSPVATFIALVLGFSGSGAGITLFWQLAVESLDRRLMVIGVPYISSIANIAGFVTPFLIGYLRDATGTYVSGFFAAATVQAIGAIIVTFGISSLMRKQSRRSEMTPASTL